MTDQDPITRLQALGSAAVPPPSEELVDALVGARLPHRAPAPGPRRPVIRFPVVLPAAALAAAILGFVLVAVGHHDGGNGSVVLQNAVDASVEVGGHSTPARAGTKVDDGTVITVGPSGSVTVNGVTLGPGELAVIRKGRLQRLRAALEGSTTTTTPGSSGASNAAPAWEQLPIAVDLEARRAASGAVTFVWTSYRGTNATGYVVVREDRTIVARRRVGGVLEAADRAAPGTRTRYVLVVLDSSRRPVARSEVVAV